MALTPLFGVPMGPELVVILLIAILLFGANKIPKLARSTGQAIGEFEKGKTQAEQELQNLREGDVSEVDTDIDTGLAGDSDADASADAGDASSDAADGSDETTSE